MTDLYQISLDTLKAGAPGLSDQTKEVLAGIIARKASLSSARASEPEAGSSIDDLVDRFSAALKEKLHAAEAKYGHDDAWMRDDWQTDLVRDLQRHVEKGDPRDVAAYCAFAWHHGWSTGTKLDAAEPYGWIYEEYAVGPGWCAPEEWWPAKFTRKPPKPASSRNVITLYTHPSPATADKLREALADLVSWFTKPVQGERGMVWVIPSGDQGADDAVAQALATLSPKEEGGE